MERYSLQSFFTNHATKPIRSEKNWQTFLTSFATNASFLKEIVTFTLVTKKYWANWVSYCDEQFPTDSVGILSFSVGNSVKIMKINFFKKFGVTCCTIKVTIIERMRRIVSVRLIIRIKSTHVSIEEKSNSNSKS